MSARRDRCRRTEGIRLHRRAGVLALLLEALQVVATLISTFLQYSNHTVALLTFNWYSYGISYRYKHNDRNDRLKYAYNSHVMDF